MGRKANYGDTLLGLGAFAPIKGRWKSWPSILLQCLTLSPQLWWLELLEILWPAQLLLRAILLKLVGTPRQILLSEMLKYFTQML